MTIDIQQYIPLLRELQTIDKRIHLVDHEIRDIPEELENSGAEYLALKRELQTKEKKLEEANKERQGLESDLKRLTEEAKKKEERVYAIKTQKEYQAQVKEIAQIKKENKERENRILSLLEEGEKLGQEITQLKSQTADKEGAYKEIEGRLTARLKVLETEKGEIVKRKPALLKELPEPLIQKYDAVRRRYTDPLAGVVGGICQGCHMSIPPQMYNVLLRATDLGNCPHCHRMIFADEGGKEENGH